MKKILIIVILVITARESNSQVIKYRVFKLCVTDLKSKKDTCKETECLVTVDYKEKKVKIYSAVRQTFDIVNVLESHKDNDPKDGGIGQQFEVVDQDAKDASLFLFMYSQPGIHKASMIITYKDYEYSYYLKANE